MFITAVKRTKFERVWSELQVETMIEKISETDTSEMVQYPVFGNFLLVLTKFLFSKENWLLGCRSEIHPNQVPQ